MYKILESVISAGNYKLAEIQYKVKKMYLLGDLTEDQMDTLLHMAAGGVSPDAERPETLAMLQTLLEQIEALDKRVKHLETANSGTETEPEEPEATAYPVWEPWNGIDTRYHPGAIVTHNGQVWESVVQGQNVWEPGTPGTEAMWVIHTEK